jgi:superfamily II DNA or RNA helicase
MVGRVLRPAPGKVNAIVLDRSGAVYRHGLPEDHVEWSLFQAPRTPPKQQRTLGAVAVGDLTLLRRELGKLIEAYIKALEGANDPSMKGEEAETCLGEKISWNRIRLEL